MHFFPIVMTVSVSLFLFSLKAQAQFYGGGPSPGVPYRSSAPVYRGIVGYRGIAVSSALPGSEPAAGQLRSYPLMGGPVAVSGIPGDPAAQYVVPYQPDVTFRGQSGYVAGYAGTAGSGRRTVFRPAPGGSALPLVLYGGFAENAMPVEDTYPVYRTYSGYYGTLAPVVGPMPSP